MRGPLTKITTNTTIILAGRILPKGTFIVGTDITAGEADILARMTDEVEAIYETKPDPVFPDPEPVTDPPLNPDPMEGIDPTPEISNHDSSTIFRGKKDKKRDD